MKNRLCKMVSIFIAAFVLINIPGALLTYAGSDKFDNDTVAKWTLFYTGGVNGGGQIVTDEKHSGSASLMIENETSVQSNVYMCAWTNVPVKKGKTYKFGFWAKAKKVNGVSAMMNWGQRYSLTPLSHTYGWTHFEFPYKQTDNSDTAQLKILCESVTKNLWIDDVTFYEYDDGQKVGDNLVANPGFESGAVVASQVTIKNNQIGDLLSKFGKENQISCSDLNKLFGGMKYYPVFKRSDIKIDGDLGEWENMPEVYLPTSSSNVREFSKYNPANTASYQRI